MHVVIPVHGHPSSTTQEVFGYNVEIKLVQFIMCILDYVAADILKVRKGGMGALVMCKVTLVR